MSVFGSIHRILATLVVAMVAMWLGKFDQIGFYHQYFRVIGEVELRNSQAIPVLDLADQVWTAPKNTLTDAQAGLTGGVTVSLLAESMGEIAPVEPVEAPVLRPPVCYLARAP